MKTKKHIIAIGAAGLEAVSQINSNTESYIFHALVKEYKEDIPSHIQQKIIEFPIYPKAFFLKGEIIELHIPQTLMRIYNNRDEYTFIIGLGGITGTSIISSLLPILHKKHCNYTIICNLPCTLWGKDRYKRAKTFIHSHAIKSIHCIDLELHYKEITENMLVSELHTRLQRIFIDIVKKYVK